MGHLKETIKRELLNLVLKKVYSKLLKKVKEKLYIFLKKNFEYIFLTAIFLKPLLKYYYIPYYMTPIMLARKVLFFILR